MTTEELTNIWDYYLVLEEDLLATMRYVEPEQLDVFSFEYMKIIILSCCEAETALKILCKSISGKPCKNPNMNNYRDIVLGKYPKIINATLTAARAKLNMSPFENWNLTNPFWWQDYQLIKHNRSQSFSKATLRNAIYSLAGLQLIVFYLSRHFDIKFDDFKTKLIDAEYSRPICLFAPAKKLPDFE